MKERFEIKSQAKASFLAQYWTCVVMSAAYAVLVSVVSGATFGVAAFLLMPPLSVGYAYFNLRIYRGEAGDVVEAFAAGFKDYGKSLVGILWTYLFTFLWSLLFLIPGIVKALAYSMTPYILTDMPNVTAKDALRVSMKMTDGHKGEIFMMALSFLGWWLLTGLTFGILAFFYTGPYTATSFAGLYEELKKNALEKNLLGGDAL